MLSFIKIIRSNQVTNYISWNNLQHILKKTFPTKTATNRISMRYTGIQLSRARTRAYQHVGTVHVMSVRWLAYTVYTDKNFQLTRL